MTRNEMRTWPDFWDALAAKTRCVNVEASPVIIEILIEPLSFADDGVRFYDGRMRTYTADQLGDMARERRRSWVKS